MDRGRAESGEVGLESDGTGGTGGASVGGGNRKGVKEEYFRKPGCFFGLATSLGSG